MPKIENAIAERTLQLRDSNGRTRDVVVRIGKPQRGRTERDDWFCPYELAGIPGNAASAAFGVDSYQALQLCFEKIRAELQHLQRATGIELRWYGKDDLGV